MEGCSALAIGTWVQRGLKLVLWNVRSTLKAVETPICAFRPTPLSSRWVPDGSFTQDFGHTRFVSV